MFTTPYAVLIRQTLKVQLNGTIPLKRCGRGLKKEEIHGKMALGVKNYVTEW